MKHFMKVMICNTWNVFMNVKQMIVFYEMKMFCCLLKIRDYEGKSRQCYMEKD